MVDPTNSLSVRVFECSIPKCHQFLYAVTGLAGNYFNITGYKIKERKRTKNSFRREKHLFSNYRKVKGSQLKK